MRNKTVPSCLGLLRSSEASGPRNYMPTAGKNKNSGLPRNAAQLCSAQQRFRHKFVEHKLAFAESLTCLSILLAPVSRGKKRTLDFKACHIGSRVRAYKHARACRVRSSINSLGQHFRAHAWSQQSPAQPGPSRKCMIARDSAHRFSRQRTETAHTTPHTGMKGDGGERHHPSDCARSTLRRRSAALTPDHCRRCSPPSAPGCCCCGCCSCRCCSGPGPAGRCTAARRSGGSR